MGVESLVLKTCPMGPTSYRFLVPVIKTYRSGVIVISADNRVTVLAAVSLQSEDAALASVTVSSRKPLIEMQANKLIVNVRNMAKISKG